MTALTLVLLLVGSLALTSIAQAEDDPYGPGLTRGELDEWFRDNFPRETELRDAILDWVAPCPGDDCWINQGKVFLAMSQVDDDDAGAEAVMGRVFFESRNGHHVTSGQLKGWIDGWLAFHAAEQAAILAALPPSPTPEPTPPPVPTPWWEDTTPAPHIVETFEVQPWECDGLGHCSYLYGEPLITCHVMSDGFVECE